MTPENQNSENDALNLQNPELEHDQQIQNQPENDHHSENAAENGSKHQADIDTEPSVTIPDEKVLSEVSFEGGEANDPSSENTGGIEEKAEENGPSNTPQNQPVGKESRDSDSSNSENIYDQEENEEHDVLHAEISALSLAQLLARMETLVKDEKAGSRHKEFHYIREEATKHIHSETEDKKNEHITAGNTAEFTYVHPELSKLSGFITIFKEKQDQHHRNLEEEHKKNLEERHQIVERLKKLNAGTEPGTNLFKEIREIKQAWSNAGQIAKADFKLLNNDYFFHLNQFYQMLDMNKEYLEQEYAHNLEKRRHIIDRAKELAQEESVQKALNELQFLHKLWKEEAEPVSEEFREQTWEEFREISNKIHDRKAELSAQMEGEQNANLERKNVIIAEITKFGIPETTPTHSYWQDSIKKVEELRTEFLKTGSVPRKISNQNWNDFKRSLRQFNTAKNEFYKSLKGSQQNNLDQKMQLIQTAKDNMHSEDWETMVPLFKKLQEDWKKIGHVPRPVTNKIWEEFREACNVFFENYRSKSAGTGDNWKENFKQKQTLLQQLEEINDEEGSVEKIEEIKNRWNSIGKVPRDRMNINSEFNRLLSSKLKLNKVENFNLKEEGLSENQVTDKARKVKNQIADLEAEIAKLENNLGFFSNPSRENPLLKDTYNKIDDKKKQLEDMKGSLHHLISGE